jgi:DNA-binding NarL/FixJ family response regulator
MTQQIRVLLVDDHPLVRTGIRILIASAPDITLVGEATNGYEARQKAVETQPDILLMDLRMPGPPATEVIAYLREHCPNTRVLVLTAHDDEVYVRKMINTRVNGYLLKEEAPETVIRAIRAIMNGDTWFSRSVMEKLAQQPVEPQISPEQLLTERERQILDLLANGWDNARIANQLNLAEQTVRNHLSRMYAKLEVRSRAEAIVWVKEQKLLAK